ncbi:MAG TPA: tRNA (5-methylaminomethyl-2-thiouridine)(34)-methyltransferase MnmD [Ohtaekwangia sp.]|nr:tRNA (5-methylaminomethyl-2-thiouridine)(34)-methyltransferase MnmD [Ohtaekwangia sp.]
MTVEIITTADGSHSLRHTELQETYHSIHGALQESNHVFIRNGLDFYLQSTAEKASIFEVGFGTGLNAWLTLRQARLRNLRIQYTAVEAYVLPEQIWSGLNYAEDEETRKDFEALHRAALNEPVKICNEFKLTKLHQRLEDIDAMAAAYDVVYFDAFAPNKQPEMWTLSVLSKIEGLMRPGALFVTYCAKGQLKRDLKSLGLIVETLEGPPGKKEMVRAQKPL